jgi:phage-related protein
LNCIVKYDNIDSWTVLDDEWRRLEERVLYPGLKAALRDFERFPERARERARILSLTALTIAAEGGKADIAKPLQGLGSGVFEIALPYKSDAFRVVYAVQLGRKSRSFTLFRRSQLRGLRRRSMRST